MPHFKCVACGTRLFSAQAPTDLVGDLCPGCGSLLEPIAPSGTHRRIAERFGDLFARREQILAEGRLDAERWLDDGGRSSVASALRPSTRPET
jgi:hypothetical protein